MSIVPITASEQERLLENFMQTSYGAPFVIVPDKFYRGSQEKGYVDLAWINFEFVALFFTTSLTRSPEKADKHNFQKGWGKWKNLWKSGDENFHVKGKNRFGDEIISKFADVKRLLIVSVIKFDVGIHIEQVVNDNPAVILISIPEKLMHEIDKFGGSITDLVSIVNLYYRMKKGLDRETNLDLLNSVVSTYLRRAHVHAKWVASKITRNYFPDTEVIAEHLKKNAIESGCYGS